MNFFANRVLCIVLLIAATKYSATNDLESTENIEVFLNSIIQFRDVSVTLEFVCYPSSISILSRTTYLWGFGGKE